MAYSNQNRRWLPIGAIIIVLLVIILGGYLALKGDRETVKTAALPRMANLPPKLKTTTPPPPSYAPDAPMLEQVRAALREGLSPSEAVAMAKTLPDRPERADAAFLLLEYAAESGNAEAAFAVGLFYDPTNEGSSGSIRKNPTTAYEWYQKALTGGQKQAQSQLARLRLWVEENAEHGSGPAKELLNTWH